MRVTSERLTVALIFVGLAVLACLAPTQSDTWWLLRAGQDSWRTGTVVLTDNYSHTAGGRLWSNHEWLTELIFYAAYRTGGLPLLTGFCAALMVGAWMLAWRLAQGPFEARLLLFAGCLASAAASFAIRPQVFSMFLFAVTSVLLAEGRTRWLIPMFILWTNLHGAVALGLVAVGAAWLAAVVSRDRLSKLTWITAGCVIATMVSPLGWRIWPEMLASMERSRVNALREWQPPGYTVDLWPFWGFVVVLPLVTLWRWRSADRSARTLAAIALAVLPLAVRSMRNVHIFLLAAMPALAGLLSAGSSVSRQRVVREQERANAAVLGLGVLAAAVVVMLAWRAPVPRLGWRPISAEAISAIRSCGDPMYNTYGDGGYLIWFVPEKRVFIDNRQDPYPVELLAANRRLELDGVYEGVFEAYGVRCAVVPPTSLSRPGSDRIQRGHRDSWIGAGRSSRSGRASARSTDQRSRLSTLLNASVQMIPFPESPG